MSEPVDRIIDELTSMRMNAQAGHTSPHKAVTMLAVIDMVASGDVADNRICYGPELLEHFQRYFDIVKTQADSCTPLNPFWHLKSEPFWHHKLQAGQESAYKTMGRPRGPNVMSEVVEYAYLDDELFECLKRPGIRMEIRDQLIRRYFPVHRDLLLEMAENEEEIGTYARALREQTPERPEVRETARDTAFARVVKQAYHYDVKRLGIFGSATTGEFKETSDLDVSVIFDRNGFEGSFERYMGLKGELEKLFGRRVDLVTVDRIRNPVFAREVEETQDVIYAA